MLINSISSDVQTYSQLFCYPFDKHTSPRSYNSCISNTAYDPIHNPSTSQQLPDIYRPTAIKLNWYSGYEHPAYILCLVAY